MRTITGIAGFLCGMAFGLALVVLNPVVFTQPAPPAPAGALRTLGWQAAHFRGIALTPQALLGLSSAGEAGDPFADPGIRHTRAEVMAIPAGAVGPALGIRLSALARHNSLLRARLGTVSQTNVMWPTVGSLFLAGSENLWTPLRDGLWSAARGRGFHPGQAGYLLPPMSGVAGTPVVIGAGGRYVGARGKYRETFTPGADGSGDFAARREVQLGIE
jgi:hypothetical protein